MSTGYFLCFTGNPTNIDKPVNRLMKKHIQEPSPAIFSIDVILIRHIFLFKQQSSFFRPSVRQFSYMKVFPFVFEILYFMGFKYVFFMSVFFLLFINFAQFYENVVLVYLLIPLHPRP